MGKFVAGGEPDLLCCGFPLPVVDYYQRVLVVCPRAESQHVVGQFRQQYFNTLTLQQSEHRVYGTVTTAPLLPEDIGSLLHVADGGCSEVLKRVDERGLAVCARALKK